MFAAAFNLRCKAGFLQALNQAHVLGICGQLRRMEGKPTKNEFLNFMRV